MASVSKVVRFYRPYLVDDENESVAFKDDFWKALRLHVDTLGAKQRRSWYSGDEYRGETGLGTSPATRYLRIGRVRNPIDWPDTVDSADKVAPLTLQGRNLLENAYLVPFGGKNKVAIMNPIRGLVPLSAIESWIGQILDLPAKGQSIELRPEIDKKALKKLKGAVAVAALDVRIPYDQDLELPDGSGSVVEKAITGAESAAADQLDVEIRFSFGRRNPNQQMGQVLKQTAERLAKSLGPDRLDVSLVLEDGDTVKREHHNLLKDQIASSARFQADANHQFSVDEILAAMNGAIEDFKSR